MNISLQPSSNNNRLLRIFFITFFLFVLSILPTRLFGQSGTGKLVITLTDIRNTQGQLLLAVYNDPTQWTDHPVKSLRYEKKDIKDGKLQVEITGLKRDIVYACALLDDENSNNEMDYKLGLPLEGFGMSRNPSFLKLKKPGFDETSFLLDGPAVRFELKLNYIRKKK